MKRRTSLQAFLSHSFIVFICLFFPGLSLSHEGFTGEKITASDILNSIYQEVKELGFYEDENFLRREFHMDLDGHATNKEEYVMVLSQNIDQVQNLVLQVTYFEQDKKNRFVKNAKETKEIKCEHLGQGFVIKKCDYEDKKVKKVLARILEGIQEKKRLLKMIKK